MKKKTHTQLRSEGRAGKLVEKAKAHQKKSHLVKTGDLEVGQKIVAMEKSLKRFSRNVVKSDGCWGWTGPIERRGYGRFFINGKHTSAHRFSLENSLGRKLLKNELACHKCDNPPCTNPNHLFAGSSKDNSQDMVLKGRHQFGSKSSRAKLDEFKVSEILSIYKRGKRGIGGSAWLARKYGVHRNTILLITERLRWKHVK